MLSTTISRELLYELTECLEDVVGYWCDEHLLSGESAWTVLLALSEAKLKQFD